MIRAGARSESTGKCAHFGSWRCDFRRIISREYRTPGKGCSIWMARLVIASHVACQRHLQRALRMVTATTIGGGLQVVRGPRSQGMRKALRHICSIVARIGVGVLPDWQTTRIMTRRTVYSRVLGVSGCTTPLRWVVAVSAFHRRVVCAVAARTLPAFVRSGCRLFIDHLKAVLLCMTLGAQRRGAAHRLVLA